MWTTGLPVARRAVNKCVEEVVDDMTTYCLTLYYTLYIRKFTKTLFSMQGMPAAGPASLSVRVWLSSGSAAAGKAAFRPLEDREAFLLPLPFTDGAAAAAAELNLFLQCSCCCFLCPILSLGEI